MIIRTLILGFLAVFFCIVHPGETGAAIDGWVLRNAQLNDMAYGEGVYVAVGENGFILRSTDGETWSRVNTGMDDNLYGVAYGGTNFVAIAGGPVLASPDGLHWTEQDLPANVYAYDLIYAEGVFVARGSDRVYLSTDGTEWTEYATGATSTQSGIAYGNGLFVIVGYGGMILTSENGSSGWTSRTSPLSPTFWDITYGETKFVAVGSSGNVVTSFDGVSWATTPSMISQTIMAVGHGEGQFVATGGNSSSDAGHVWTSPDGEVWTERVSGIFEWMYDVKSINDKYYITGGKIITSDDGINWTAVHDATGWDVWSVAYGDGIYAAGTMTGTSIRSTDGGKTWTAMTSPHDSTIGGIAYNADQGLFVGVCTDGQILSAGPANDYWVTTVYSISAGLQDVAYDPGTGNTVMVGNSGTIAMIDGYGVLSTVGLLTSQALSGVAVAGSTYVAVGWGGTVITSLDAGATWQTTTPATSEGLQDVVYGNGLWVSVGYSGAIVTSPDGINWMDVSGPYGILYGISFGDGYFVAHGGNGTIIASTNGENWDEFYVTDSWLPASTYAEGRFTIAGGDGVILQSTKTGGGKGGGCSTITGPGTSKWTGAIEFTLMILILTTLRRKNYKAESRPHTETIHKR